MFTGIITHQGELIREEILDNLVYWEVYCLDSDFFKNIKIGSSIAHDGACLTVLEIDKNSHKYKVQLIPETLQRTAFKKTKTGYKFNLEKSLKAGDPIDGHFVLGHIDGVAKVIAIKEGSVALDKENRLRSWVVRFGLKQPSELIKYLTYKGSVAINGVSLTISKANPKSSYFEVSLIEHTLKNTNLGKLKTGQEVNIEIDTLARYVLNNQ